MNTKNQNLLVSDTRNEDNEFSKIEKLYEHYHLLTTADLEYDVDKLEDKVENLHSTIEKAIRKNKVRSVKY